MLSVLMSTAQHHGYTGVLISNLQMERQWDLLQDVGRGGVVFFPLVKYPLSSVCLAANYTARLH